MVVLLRHAAPLLVGWLMACGPSPSERLVGWPDAIPVPTGPSDESDATVVDTTSLAVEAPGSGDVDPAAKAPCKALAELACSYFGPYTDECALARTEKADDGDAATRDACLMLLNQFKTVEEPMRMNPCRRYSRLVCKREGSQTRLCQTSRENLPLLRKAEEKRACLGDLLLYQAGELRR
ncbi:MAG: hypothetical protein ACI9MR_004431 [Myxococcota bacterium]|jgi:hypothetical protein